MTWPPFLVKSHVRHAWHMALNLLVNGAGQKEAHKIFDEAVITVRCSYAAEAEECVSTWYLGDSTVYATYRGPLSFLTLLQVWQRRKG